MSASDDFLKRETDEEDLEEQTEQRKANIGALAMIALTAVLLTIGYNWLEYLGYIGQN